nr:EcsC family protein [Nitrobacter hamburgensis]
MSLQEPKCRRRTAKPFGRPSGLSNIQVSPPGSPTSSAKPVELIGYALPSFASNAITSATSKGLEGALSVALRTLPRSSRPGSQLLHRALATASGAAGGTFGLAALPVELPVSTVIMLRSIADIAQSEGENLSDPETALSCVEVFALGGRVGSADASESGYFAVRGMLAKAVTEAARFVAERGVIKEGAPILLKFVTQVAARFGLVVTQKVERRPSRWSARSVVAR